MVVGSPLVDVMEAESCFSDCFGLSQERGLFGEGAGFSFSSDDMLEKEGGRSDRTTLSGRPMAAYFYPGAGAYTEGRPGLGRVGRLRDKYLSIHTCLCR